MVFDRDRLVKPVKKLHKLVNKMDSKPTPGKVHDLRTSTRRFEAIFEALSLDGQGISKSTLKSLRRVRKRAGKVRDMDVLTGYASTVRPQGEEECAVQLLEQLGKRRSKYAKRLYAEIKRVRPELRADLKRASGIVGKLTRNNGDGPGANAVAPNAAATAIKLAIEVAVPERLGRENLHAYRLKVKELVYVLQMAAGASNEKVFADLREVKDAIGEWHDWEALVLIGQESLDHGNRCGLVTELKRVAKSKYKHALAMAEALRQEYLQSSSPKKKGVSAGATRVPSYAVWQAVARLAG